jgi:hypothetical protein
VLFTRLLSVSTWYGLAFLVLSLAMLGLTGGSLAAARAQKLGEPLDAFVARSLLRFAGGLVLATAVICAIPLSFAPDLTSFGSLVIVAGALTAPMVSGGAVIARLLGEANLSLSRLYAIDLAAAAAGAVAPLVLLGPFSAQAALLLLATLAALASAIVTRAGRRMAMLAMLACAGLFWLTRSGNRGLHVKYPKGIPADDAIIPVFEASNSLSHVTLSPFGPRPFPLWSQGTNVKLRNHPVGTALIDGEAGTVVYAYASLDKLDLLKSDATATAHALRPSGRACVIGIGGGRDLLTALLFGHDEVVGIEINPAMVKMLESIQSFSPILADPRVRVILGDGRAELARSGLTCQVLQASLVDTWAATSAGAFAHTESTLYTREAWALFLDRVAPDGILTFSRWYEPTRTSETSRLLSLAVASLLDRGAANPRDHIALIAAGAVATSLVSPAPLRPADLEVLRARTQELGIEILAMPGVPPKDPLLEQLLSAHDIGALGDAGRPHKLDTSPPTDDRPFFFQLLAPRAWLSPSETLDAAKHQRGALAGNVASAFELLATLLGSLFVAVILLGPTLLRSKEEGFALPSRRAAGYFACLGAGFMVAEVGLVQRLHVVLGHPTYALVVVLAGLLVATGIGSLLSERFVTTERAVVRAAQLGGLLLLILPWAIIGPLARATATSPMWIRVSWSLAVAASVGLVLGTLFPAAVRYLDRTSATPLALAINGAAAVIGSVLCVVVSVSFGIPYAFAFAALLYGLAAVCGPTSWPQTKTTD